MADDEAEKLLNEIGQLLTEDREYPFEPTLLYAQLDRNMVGESIFKELGNQVLYRRPVIERLPYALLDLWEAQEGDDRWAEMEYLLRDGKFDVAYIYPNEIDPEEDVVERRARAVRRHFGEKPIVYPPWPLRTMFRAMTYRSRFGQSFSVAWKFSNDLSAQLCPLWGTIDIDR